jgi:hypothetical protein
MSNMAKGMFGILAAVAALAVMRLVGGAFVPMAVVLLPLTALGTIAAIAAILDSAQKEQQRNPFSLPDGGGNEIPSYFRRRPEMLFAIAVGVAGEKRVMRSIYGLGLLANEWDAYGALATSSREQWEKFESHFVNSRNHILKEVRDDVGPISPGKLARSAVRAFDKEVARQSLEEVRLSAVLKPVVVAYMSAGAHKDAVLERMRGRVLQVLRAHYPDATVSTGAGARSLLSDYRKITKANLKLRRANRRWKAKVRALEESLDEERAKNRLSLDLLEARVGQGIHTERIQLENERKTLAASVRAARTKEREIINELRQKLQLMEAREGELRVEIGELETLIFSESDSDSYMTHEDANLTGVRIALIGGNPDKSGTLRMEVEARGAVVVQANDQRAVELVDSSTIVVFWTRFLSHDIYRKVKTRASARGLPALHWHGSSPEQLICLVADRLGVDRTSMGPSDPAQP